MAQWIFSLLFGTTVLWTMLIPHSSFPTGAPASACENMLPGHTGIQPQQTLAPFEFLVSSPSFLNGQPINIQIVGPAYRGLLLEARSFRSTTALGFWKSPPNNTKYLQCSGNPHGAVTHSNTNLKTRQTTYTWLPPNSGCPPVVTFMATVALSHEIYWTNIRSKVIWKNPKATCGAEMPTRKLPAAALLSLLLILFEYI
ncbi:putative defense protein 3 [Sphaerodactylus townsendi]|uniref:putative defense protein 3 n=1 Tax=Sphaerodactylus townsendi TaxID=933632 RepID=UPI002025F183|nr:putative defense protein 3 [Sphaerodactylus townsendi]XP_048370014.1 putative defense protein 3 [Sphaerodactylus townsendi]